MLAVRSTIESDHEAIVAVMTQSSEAQAVNIPDELLSAEIARLEDKISRLQNELTAKEAVIAGKDALIAKFPQQHATVTPGSEALSGIATLAGGHQTLQTNISTSERRVKKPYYGLEPPLQQEAVLQPIFALVGLRQYFT